MREVARRLEMSTGLIYTWRRQLGAGQLAPPSFAQVELAEPAAAPVPTTSSRTGLIEIALSCGTVVRVDRDVDAATLARVLEVVR